MLFSCLAAILVFAVVQDRVTAAGARRFVALQRLALASGSPPIAVDEVMRPAIRQSVERGALWGGVTLAAAIGGGVMIRRRRRE
jgi:hypothetical protein